MNPLPDVAGDLAELMENQGLFSKSVERKCATYKSHRLHLRLQILRSFELSTIYISFVSVYLLRNGGPEETI
jgi:hypothetical protein